MAAPAPALPPAPQPLAGTRAGLAGHTVISSGVRALDELLGGGVPLGSLLVVLEDGFSGAHELLLRHFLAEGAACGHRCVLGAQPHKLQQLLAAVPAVAGAGRESEGLGTTCDDETRKGRTDTKGGDDDGLHIAFQYRRYIGRQQRLQRQREAKEAAQAQRGSSVGGGKGAKRARAPALSHAFDLLSPLPRGKLERATGLRTVEIERAAEGGRAVAEATREAVAGCAAQPSAIRVLVRSLGEEEAFSGGGGGEGQSLFARAVSLVSALRRIKAAIAPGAQPVAAALVTIPSALFDSDLASRLSSLADGIVRLDQVRAPRPPRAVLRAAWTLYSRHARTPSSSPSRLIKWPEGAPYLSGC